MAAVGGEAVDHRVTVAVGDVDLAVGGDGGIGRMVERRAQARPMALAERREGLAVGGQDQDLVGVAIDQKQAVVRRDRDAVRIRDPAFGQTALQRARGSERQDGRLAALKHVDRALGVDRELADLAWRHAPRPLPPRPLDAVASIA